jgi:hypothetical protein
METGNYLAVWPYEEGAKRLLGLSKSPAESRWCVLGVLKGESAIGPWLKVDAVQERQGPDNKVIQTWAVHPDVCLIRWDFIIHAQLWSEPVPEKKEVGFKEGAAHSSLRGRPRAAGEPTHDVEPGAELGPAPGQRDRARGVRAHRSGSGSGSSGGMAASRAARSWSWPFALASARSRSIGGGFGVEIGERLDSGSTGRRREPAGSGPPRTSWPTREASGRVVPDAIGRARQRSRT